MPSIFAPPFRRLRSQSQPTAAPTAVSPTAVLIRLAGQAIDFKQGSLTIRDVLGAAPNTATALRYATAPPVGNDIQIGLGGLDPSRLLFAGEVEAVDASYIDTAGFTIWPVTLIDYTFRLNKKRPFGSWTTTSATVIALAIIDKYAPGFTGYNVQKGLPSITIAFDGSQDFGTCMQTIANLMGGYYGGPDCGRDIHLFLTETTNAPDALDGTHSSFVNDPPITASTDLSQIRTRVYVKGAGTTVPTDILVTETILPLGDATVFGSGGGQALAGSQVLTYTSVQAAAAGTLIGTPAAPAAAPSSVIAVGTGLGTGVYGQAYTFVTAAGESLPSPTESLTTGTLADPTTAPTIANHGGAADTWGNGFHYAFKYAYSTAALSTDLSALTNLSSASGTLTNDGTSIDFTCPYSTDAGVNWVVIYFKNLDLSLNYVTYTGGGVLVLANNSAGGTLSSTLISNHLTGSSTNATNANTTTALQLKVQGIALGPTGTTSRKVYRTAVGGSQLKLQQTIANNTATTGVQDSTADGSLGANVPTSDTSGLTTTQGQINAGSTSVLTAGWAGASAGWATIGSQTIRYTGVSGNTLTGVPASGAGALLSTVKYGDVITPTPSLLGVTGMTIALLKGTAINLWVQRDDTTAQIALGLLELDPNGIPTDGIHEYVVADSSLTSVALCQARGDAELTLFKNPIVTIAYTTRDIKTKSGKTVHVALAAPLNISGDFMIQDVTITFDGPALNPLFTVKASSVMFTIADLQRRAALLP